MIDISRLRQIAEGKTKIIYENPHDERTVFLYFKDDITAGDGARHDLIEGKALLDWRVNRDVFEYLNRSGIGTHYVESPQERLALVRRLDKKINLEVVSRRVAAGSIVKWGGIEEGTFFDPPVTQFHYKDDGLHDPMLDSGFISYLAREKGSREFEKMKAINESVLLCLERAFAHFGIQLVDLKLEYGIVGGEVCLIDEVSGGSMRLWPFRSGRPDPKKNILDRLDPGGRLDKDTYRRGEGFEAVLSKFAQIARITERFGTIPPWRPGDGRG